MTLKWAIISGVAVTVIVAEVTVLAFGLKFLHRLPIFNLSMDPLLKQEADEQRLKLASAKQDSERCYPLATIAKYDFNNGNISEAKKYATKLLALVPKAGAADPNDASDYAIAVHDGNMVLGRIALKEGDKEKAKKYLLAAGLSTGAPTLDSFGPNMSLANDLLEVGERDTVEKYFEECKRFWTFEGGKKLDDWEQEVKDGGTPDFGANLIY